MRLVLEFVLKQVAAVRRHALEGDHERAHLAEDALAWGVLALIAAGKCERPGDVAAAALRSRNVEFPRHCG